AVSVTAILYFTAAQARKSGERPWSRSARTVVLAMLPAFWVGVVLSHVMFHQHLRHLLPGTWMLLYGCGALAMSFFTPLSIRALGISFMLAGSAALLFFPGHDVWAMGLSFGGLHLVWGTSLALERHGLLTGRRADTALAQDR